MLAKYLSTSVLLHAYSRQNDKHIQFERPRQHPVTKLY